MAYIKLNNSNLLFSQSHQKANHSHIPKSFFNEPHYRFIFGN